MQTAICEKNLAGINFSTSCLLHVNIMQRDWQEETAIQELQLPTWSGSETKNQHRLQGIFHCPVARGAELLSRVLLCWIQYTKAGKNASRWQTQQQVKWTYLLFYSIHHLSLEHVPNKWGLLCFATVQIFFQVDVSDFVQTLFGHNNADPDTGIVFHTYRCSFCKRGTSTTVGHSVALVFSFELSLAFRERTQAHLAVLWLLVRTRRVTLICLTSTIFTWTTTR